MNHDSLFFQAVENVSEVGWIAQGLFPGRWPAFGWSEAGEK